MGIATGFAVGGILAEQLTGRTDVAGFGQTASILGAGILAVPLARLAAARSRRLALTLGFALAAVGALLVVLAAATGATVPFFLGMAAFGAATASGLQSRFAAMDVTVAQHRARAMSLVVWATTVGSVAGPNLASFGGEVGRLLGIGELGGPFALSALGFALAATATFLLRIPTPLGVSAPTGASSADESSPAHGHSEGAGSEAPITRVLLRNPRALQGLIALVIGHVLMVAVMVMTPVHLHGEGASIRIVGIVISLHILGMYGLSPLLGALIDRVGSRPVIALGFALFALALGLGIWDGLTTTHQVRVTIALILLGVAWSHTFLAGSAQLTAALAGSDRIRVQGVSDAAMNYGAALFAAGAGPLLASGGFALINGVAAAVLVATIVVIMLLQRRQTRLSPRRENAQQPPQP